MTRDFETSKNNPKVKLFIVLQFSRMLLRILSRGVCVFFERTPDKSAFWLNNFIDDYVCGGLTFVDCPSDQINGAPDTCCTTTTLEFVVVSLLVSAVSFVR